MCTIDKSSTLIKEGGTILNCGETVQAVINTGICNVFTVTIVGYLLFRNIAATLSPATFLNSRIVGILIRACVLVYNTGAIHSVSVLSQICIYLFRFAPDDSYIIDFIQE